MSSALSSWGGRTGTPLADGARTRDSNSYFAITSGLRVISPQAPPCERPQNGAWIADSHWLACEY
jgi:hypothetical protein